MIRVTRYLLVGLVFTIGTLGPTGAVAQQEIGRMTLIPRVGYFAGNAELTTGGGAAVPGRAVAFQLGNAVTFGAAVSVPLLADWLEVRGSLDHSPWSSLEGSVFEGQTSCGTQCFRNDYRTDDFGSARWTGVSLTLQAKPSVTIGGVQPVLGVGRAASWSSYDAPSGHGELVFRDKTGGSWVFNAGVTVELGRVDAVVESAFYRSRLQGNVGETDIVTTVGIALPIR